MPIEYAQLLSTAHRLLDGTMWIDRTANNRRIKRWRLDDDREDNLYKAGHINHPSQYGVEKLLQTIFIYFLYILLHLQSLLIDMVNYMVQVNLGYGYKDHLKI